MNQQNYEREIYSRIPWQVPRPVLGIFGLLLLLGLIVFVVGATGDHPQRAWQAFLVNFLIWSGIGQAGVVFAALLHVSNGRWGGSIRRIAESLGAFLPISFVLFLVLILGGESLFPWIHEPVPAKAAWLNAGAMFTRDGLALLVIYGLSLVFLYYSLRQDLGLAAERGLGKPKGIYQTLIANWRGIEVERQRCQRALSVLSPIILILYAYIFSLLAFDLVMSLSPHWYSNLFGAYYFMGNLYIGIAAITIMTVMVRKHLQLEKYITLAQLHDLGKLMFGFAIFWAYLTFTQYLVIWYGNLPEETEYLIVRIEEAPWSSLSLVVAALCFLVPFIGLIPREPKRRPGYLLTMSVIIIIGMWLERILLVVPSIWHEHDMPMGITEIFTTLGFLGAFALTCLPFLFSHPPLPLADPAVPDEGAHGHAEATA